MQVQSSTSIPVLPAVKTLFRAGGNVVRIDEISEKQQIWLTDVASTVSRVCSFEAFEKARSAGILVAVDETAVVKANMVPIHLRRGEELLIEGIPAAFRTEKALDVMLTKLRWLNWLKSFGVKNFCPSEFLAASIRDIEHSKSEKCPYRMDAIYKAARVLRSNGGDHRCLLPQLHLRGGPGVRRLDAVADQIIDAALEAAEKPASGMLRPSKVMKAVKNLTEAHNATQEIKVQEPSLPTVTRRFNEHFDPYQVCVRNEGKKRADQKFREAGARVRADQALDVVHYDDTDTATFLIDERTQLPWGRAWLTAGIDENTSAIHGIALSERSRSSESALEAVVHGIFPKDPAHPMFSLCKDKWEFYGQPGVVNMDNASYNATLMFQASVLEFDVEVAFARPHRPTDKTDIEHFNHRIKAELIQDFPGWVGPKEDRERLDVGLGSAIMTLGHFRKRIVAWIADEYSNTPCGRLGLTPREAWREQFRDVPPLLPKRRPSQELMGTIFKELRFRDSGGLLRMGLRYQSEPLALLRRRLGSNAPVTTRFSPNSLAFLYVLDPFTKNYLKVPCIEDPRYVEGLTNYQQSLVLKKAKQMKMKSPGLKQMYEARLRLIEDTESLMNSKKLRQRKQSFQLHKSGLAGLDSAPSDGSAQDSAAVIASSSSTTKVKEVMVLPVEDMVMDLEEEFEFDFDEEMSLE